MDLKEVEEALVRTLDDAQLSRGEKRALRMLLDERGLQAEDRARLRSHAFDLARDALEGRRKAEVLEWLEGVLKVLDVGEHGASIAEAHFSPGDACRLRLADLMTRAKDAIDVCVFTITDDRLAQGLVDAQRRGVRVRVISDDDKAFDPGSDVDMLKARGIQVRLDRGHQHMHHKFALFDASILATGSYNWTRSAADENYENLVVTDEARLVARFAAEFERLFAEL